MSFKNLYLHHAFTNRGGYETYEIYAADDSKTRKNPLGTVQLPPEGINTDSLQWVEDKGVDTGHNEQLELPLQGVK
ncbi:MAG: hypothetical protein DRQ40_05705 [Gammaproteobacteria bacterium]|nr:MAG: hypothetical protein DRQ40_05705 [Gammaproteobacteria bacterium]